MGPLKKHITPPGFKGQVVKHAGKGAAPFPQPKPGPLTMGAPSMNNYAKSTPMPNAPQAPAGPGPMASNLAPSGPGQDFGMV